MKIFLSPDGADGSTNPPANESSTVTPAAKIVAGASDKELASLRARVDELTSENAAHKTALGSITESVQKLTAAAPVKRSVKGFISDAMDEANKMLFGEENK